MFTIGIVEINHRGRWRDERILAGHFNHCPTPEEEVLLIIIVIVIFIFMRMMMIHIHQQCEEKA